MAKTPLAIYIHWPFCKSKCPYCDFNSHVRDSVDQDRWKDALLRELRHMAAHVPAHEVESIFFGGGTPSLMPAATAQALIEEVYKLWPTANDIEITLEANPTSVETDTFANFAAAGVNRVSLGVQALNERDLRFLGRNHSPSEALKAVERARHVFKRYSFDLIYARPGQSVAAWEDELNEALTFAGGHLSLYQLTIEPNTAFFHAVAKGEFAIPGEEEAQALYMLTEGVMEARGFASYEVSNYARPGEESRHNLAYWKGHDYIGVGPGAHGRLRDNHTRIATETIKSPERWLEAVGRDGHAVSLWEPVDAQGEIMERLMMGLRLAEGISYARFTEQTGTDLAQSINQKKREFYTKEGLLTDSQERLQATLSGRLVLNTLLSELLA